MDTRTVDTLASRSRTRHVRSSASMTVAVLLLAAGVAGAADYGIGAKKLLLKSSGKIVLVSKEMVLSGADPLGGTDSWISFDAGSGPVDDPGRAQPRRREHVLHDLRRLRQRHDVPRQGCRGRIVLRQRLGRR